MKSILNVIKENILNRYSMFDLWLFRRTYLLKKKSSDIVLKRQPSPYARRQFKMPFIDN